MCDALGRPLRADRRGLLPEARAELFGGGVIGLAGAVAIAAIRASVRF
jgi:hypothetical protein